MTTPNKTLATPDKLKPKQIRAIELIMSGLTLQEVAVALHISRQTLSDWKHHHPVFRATLEALRAEAEEELHYAAPMKHAFVLSQLLKLTAEGTPESRLKAIEAYLDRFAPKDAGDATSKLSEDDRLILRAMQRRREDSPTATREFNA